MPRYYFHLRNGLDLVDEEGTEFSDLEAARQYALASIRDLVSSDIRNGWLDLDHAVEIADEAGAALLRMPFREAFETRRQAPPRQPAMTPRPPPLPRPRFPARAQPVCPDRGQRVSGAGQGAQ